MRNSYSPCTDAHKQYGKRESAPLYDGLQTYHAMFCSEAAAAAAAIANPTSLVIKPRPLTMRESQLVDHLVRLQLVSFPSRRLKRQFVDFWTGSSSRSRRGHGSSTERSPAEPYVPFSYLLSSHLDPFSYRRKCTQCRTHGQHSQAINHPTQYHSSRPRIRR